MCHSLLDFHECLTISHDIKFNDTATPFLKIVLHGNNLENVYKQIPMEMLPEEYLPDDYTGKCAGPLKGLIGKCLYQTDCPAPNYRN